MRTSPKLDQQQKIKSPQPLFGKPVFSPHSRARARSQTTLNVRRFSTDSVLNSQSLTIDRSTAIGRRLSKDASFLNSSPPDINSRRSSYLDMLNSSSKLSGKSPVLSIENVSQAAAESGSIKRLNDVPRKYSDAESIGRKLATLPKYKDNINTNRLHPGDRLHMGKSDETLSKSDNYTDTLKPNEIAPARSYQDMLDNKKRDLEIEEPGTSSSINLTSSSKNTSNLSDDEIARRNKLTIEQLRSQLNEKIESIKPQIKRTTSNTTPQTTSTLPALPPKHPSTLPPKLPSTLPPKMPSALPPKLPSTLPPPLPTTLPPATLPSTLPSNPSIRIEDTSRPERSEGTSRSSRSAERRIKHRHRSLGEAPKSPLPPEPIPVKRNRRVTEHSR